MNKAWICESCCDLNFENTGDIFRKFLSQDDLIQHIFHHHLSKKIVNGRTVFICTYGPSGVCIMASAQNPIEFDSEYEYERHLVSKHLIGNLQPKVSSQFRITSISDPNLRPWTQYDSVVNMAAVLNDPTDRQLDIFSRCWGEAFERAVVPPLRIPVITEEHFFPYLSLLSRRKHCPPIPKVSSNLRDCKPLNEETERIYCSANFKLSNPETFNRVIPLYRRHQCPNLLKIFSHQSDQLSQHLDAVELAIVNHVSERSPAFFEAVQAHDVVKDQLSQIIPQVTSIRTRLREADANYCHNVGQVVKLARRRENLKKVLAKLEIILFVHSAQPTIQSLLQSNDFCSALDLISDTRESLSTINTDAEIICLRHLDAQLAEIEKFINNMIESEFHSALQSFLNVNAVEKNGDVNGVSEILLPSILGLIRINQTNFVDTIEKEVQQILSETFERIHASFQIGVNGHAQGNSKNSLVAAFEIEPFNVWLGKLKTACLTVENLLTRVKLIVELVCLANVGDGHGVRLRGIYWKTADRGQQKLESLISAHLWRTRKQQRVSLPIASSDDFVAFAQVIEDFHERVIVPAWQCYRPDLPLTSKSMALRKLAATQAAILVSNFHKERCKILDSTLNQETWRPAEKGLDPTISRLLNHLLTHHELAESIAVEGKVETTSTKLVLQGESYVVVDTVFTLIPLILDYLRLGEQLATWPLQLCDIQQNLAQFLTLFNSRSCKLVLGAEALERQLLKRIVARNMALVARSLECLLVLTPVLHVYFERIHFKSVQSKIDCQDSVQKNQKGSSRFVDPFYDVNQDIQSHISQVLDMITSLLATNISRAMHTWRPRPPTPSTEMRLVCQVFSKLIESTNGILSEVMLNNLLIRAHVEFKANLRQRLTDLAIYPDGGPQQGLVNSELVFYMNFFCGLTSSLKNFKDECEEIWPSRKSTTEAD